VGSCSICFVKHPAAIRDFFKVSHGGMWMNGKEGVSERLQGDKPF
jgi:hypothetical protein